VYARRALLFEDSAALARAREDLTEALRLSPGRFSLLKHRATVSLKLGDKESALNDLDACIELDNTSCDALQLRATLLESLGKEEQASVDREHARKLKERILDESPPDFIL
ncbi:MAG: hypothetical protein K2Z81_03165, partial [Cyanobacteria bacterium]|nr:hypothetical protein [Cyanobacteriota bacterium]